MNIINILGISEVKWSGMVEFNFDDHYIYYCGQESLRRNGTNSFCFAHSPSYIMKEVNKVEEKIFVTILIKTFLYPFYKKCEVQGQI